jgi:hypothetical protein
MFSFLWGLNKFINIICVVAAVTITVAAFIVCEKFECLRDF